MGIADLAAPADNHGEGITSPGSVSGIVGLTLAGGLDIGAAEAVPAPAALDDLTDLLSGPSLTVLPRPAP